MTLLVVGLLLVLAGVAWEVHERSSRSFDVRRQVYDGLKSSGVSTGVWIIESVGERAASIREQLLAPETMQGPSGFTDALHAAGRHRILDHQFGPSGLSREQAASWIENVGPSLSTIRLRARPRNEQVSVFALAYASEHAPQFGLSAEGVGEHLGGCFAASLVACVQLPSRHTMLPARWISLGGASFVILFALAGLATPSLRSLMECGAPRNAALIGNQPVQSTGASPPISPPVPRSIRAVGVPSSAIPTAGPPTISAQATNASGAVVTPTGTKSISSPRAASVTKSKQPKAHAQGDAKADTKNEPAGGGSARATDGGKP